MRVLVTGDRNWTDKQAIREALVNVRARTVIEGGARGADKLAREAGKELRLNVEEFPAHWTHSPHCWPRPCRRPMGDVAGPARNQQMLDEGKPDLVLAFHNCLEASKGTADMVARAVKAGVPIYLYERGSWRML